MSVDVQTPTLFQYAARMVANVSAIVMMMMLDSLAMD